MIFSIFLCIFKGGKFDFLAKIAVLLAKKIVNFGLFSGKLFF